MTRRTTAAALTAAALLGIAGCSSGGGDSATDASGVAPEVAANSAPEAARADGGSGAAQDDAGSGSAGVITQAVQDGAGRDIVYTIELSVTTDDVDDAARQATSIATTAGGFVADERTSGDHDATLTLKIPTAAHADALAALEKIGEVDHRTRTTQDVTDQVVDTASRIDSQRASIARIRALLDQASDLTQIISIETELASREADLDALLSTQEQLTALTSMATITVSFYAPGDEPADDDADLGFLSGLSNGWDAFTGAVAVALTVVGAVLPFAILAAIVVVPVVWWLRRRRSPATAEGQLEAPPAG
ncbi:MAG TPA: DUF4349 domain-containing protein [Jiangellaceae bacterium]